MSKKNLYYIDAEQLYVVEQMSVSKIAAYFRLATSTVSKWKKAGNWQNKRENLLKLKLGLQKELCEFVGKLIYSINEEFNKEQKIDSQKMYMLAKIFPLLAKILKNKQKGGKF